MCICVALCVYVCYVYMCAVCIHMCTVCPNVYVRYVHVYTCIYVCAVCIHVLCVCMHAHSIIYRHVYVLNTCVCFVHASMCGVHMHVCVFSVPAICTQGLRTVRPDQSLLCSSCYRKASDIFVQQSLACSDHTNHLIQPQLEPG